MGPLSRVRRRLRDERCGLFSCPASRRSRYLGRLKVRPSAFRAEGMTLLRIGCEEQHKSLCMDSADPEMLPSVPIGSPTSFSTILVRIAVMAASTPGGIRCGNRRLNGSRRRDQDREHR